MEHKKKRADNLQGVPATVPALAAHLEMFAKAVAEGDSHVEAAVICGRKRGSASFLYAQPGVKERIAELKTIARDATEKAIVNNRSRSAATRSCTSLCRECAVENLHAPTQEPQGPEIVLRMDVRRTGGIR
jgi:hypothetical protein